MPKFALFAFLFMMGCQVGPKYNPPRTDNPVPQEWKNDLKEEITVDADSDAPDLEHWWEIFDEAELNELEDAAIAYNKTLEETLEVVLEARAQTGIVRADLFPQLTINPLYTNQGILEKLFGASSATPGIKPIMREHILQYLLPLNLNYEVDLWGFYRNRYASAYFNYQAQQQAFQTALLVLTADVASIYYQIRALDALIELYQSTLITRQKAFNITQSRYDYQVSDYLSVAQAGVDLYNVQSLYEDAVRQREIDVDALAVLIGANAPDFDIKPKPLQGSPPAVPPGIPSDVLLRRPDIVQAERTMASQHALINVAVANFLPSFSLTGSLGYSSPDMAHFLKWISRYFAMQAVGNQTIFDGGRDSAEVDQAWANFAQASAEYQQTVLVAFQEVEDALANLKGYAKEAVSVAQAVEYAHKAYTISLDRYVRGVDFYLNVVDSERQELDNQRALVGIIEQWYIATIQLIKALGGGWN